MIVTSVTLGDIGSELKQVFIKEAQLHSIQKWLGFIVTK